MLVIGAQMVCFSFRTGIKQELSQIGAFCCSDLYVLWVCMSSRLGKQALDLCVLQVGGWTFGLLYVRAWLAGFGLGVCAAKSFLKTRANGVL